MGLFTKDIETLNDAFVSGLQHLYYAEREIADTLPKMVDKATDPALKDAFALHLRQTETHIARLEQVFAMHGVEAETATCPAIDGILKAGNSMAGDISDKIVLDAALASAAQMVEHYEIAEYGTLIAWAKALGRSDCASVLQQTLDEEKSTDIALTQLAETRINSMAA